MTILRTNACFNPSCERAVTGFTQIAGTGGTASTALFAATGHSGSSVARTTWTVATSAVSGGIIHGSSAQAFFGISIGTAYTWSAYVRSSVTQRIVPDLRFFTSGGAQVGSPVLGSELVISANTWTRISILNVTTPATAVRAYFHANAVPGTSGVNWAVGNTMDMDAVLVEPVATLQSYFDGSYPNGRWNGQLDNAVSFIDDLATLTYLGASTTQVHTTSTGTATASSGDGANGNFTDNLAVLLIMQKPDTASNSWAPSGVGDGAGWTLLAEQTGGTGAFGVDTGPTRIKAYINPSLTSVQGVPLVATLATNSSIITRIFYFSRIPGGTIESAASTGTDNTTGTPYSVTLTNPGYEAFDYYISGLAFPTDISPTFSAPTYSATGMSIIEQSTSSVISGTGSDVGGRWAVGYVSAGPATSSITYSFTLAGTTTNAAGPAIGIRIRNRMPRRTLSRRQVRQAVNRAGSF